MGLIERVAGLWGYEKRALPDPSWAALRANLGYPAALNARAAENLAVVLGCTTAISTALAYVPSLVYSRAADSSRIEALDHPLVRIVREGVNEHMTWPDFVEHWLASTLLTGNGLAEIMRGRNGRLLGFRFIPWNLVSVVQLSSGRLAYDVSDGRGNMRRLLQGEVIHLRDRSDDGLVGRSRLSRAADTVQGALVANEFARGFLSRGAAPSGAIEYPGTIPPENKLNLREQFERIHSGPSNAGRTLILDGGLTWKSIQVSPEDAELLATRKFGVEEICRLFQVPPPLVQDYSHNTFTNSETAGRWFAQFTLGPWARKIEAEFARSVFPAGGPYELELDLSGFLRGDPQTRWAAHEIALRNGVLDPDEVRQVEGWNPRAKREAAIA
jgi:HK97 family phage portal protein